MTSFDVVLVSFPFSDSGSKKKRPALIAKSYSVKGLGEFYIICMITSQVEGIAFPHDLAIQDLEAAGLPKASLIRPSKVVTIEKKLVQKQLGTLGKKDTLSFKRAWTKSISEN